MRGAIELPPISIDLRNFHDPQETESEFNFACDLALQNFHGPLQSWYSSQQARINKDRCQEDTQSDPTSGDNNRADIVSSVLATSQLAVDEARDVAARAPPPFVPCLAHRRHGCQHCEAYNLPQSQGLVFSRPLSRLALSPWKRNLMKTKTGQAGNAIYIASSASGTQAPQVPNQLRPNQLSFHGRLRTLWRSSLRPSVLLFL